MLVTPPLLTPTPSRRNKEALDLLDRRDLGTRREEKEAGMLETEEEKRKEVVMIVVLEVAFA